MKKSFEDYLDEVYLKDNSGIRTFDEWLHDYLSKDVIICYAEEWGKK